MKGEFGLVGSKQNLRQRRTEYIYIYWEVVGPIQVYIYINIIYNIMSSANIQAIISPIYLFCKKIYIYIFVSDPSINRIFQIK